LKESLLPIDLGADIGCDSAHKTLPVLTGGAYLHLSAFMENTIGAQVKDALMLFGSTSPSYLILQSLDAANVYMADYRARLQRLLPLIDKLKERLIGQGYSLYGNEPLKLTICTKSYGYTGNAFADMLRKQNLEPEFADPDHIVLLLSAHMSEEMLDKLDKVLCTIPHLPFVEERMPDFVPAERVSSVREAMMSPSETLPAKECIGRVLAVPTVGCPPAVPILVCGEKIDEHALKCFDYYGIDRCCVVKENT
jgi:arginine/lysine/ornithine decarboxylase